jgi:hypothetical protein
MANVKLIFQSSHDSVSEDELSCFVNSSGFILVCVNSRGEYPEQGRSIELDRSTAIKLSKVLRTCISELEVTNE